MTITFSDPIVFAGNNRTKTWSQRALEIVDESLCFRPKWRVSIFRTNEGKHGQTSKIYDESWIKTAAKVVFLCTVIPPLFALIADAILRRYLNVHLIKKLSISSENQQTLINLVKSENGGAYTWVCSMNELMSDLGCNPNSPKSEADDCIEIHSDIGYILAKSKINLEQMKIFCAYLTLDLMVNSEPWIVYRVLEKYLVSFEKSEPLKQEIHALLSDYLTKKARKYIKPCDRAGGFSYKNKEFNYYTVFISSEIWFGPTRFQNSLLRLDQLPEIFVKVLWDHIKEVSKFSNDNNKLLQVEMFGAFEAQLPIDFTLPLAQLIVKNKIFLEHNDTIQDKQVVKSPYARKIDYLTKQEYEGFLKSIEDTDSNL